MSEPHELTGWGRTAPTVAATIRSDAAGVPEAVRRAGARGLIARGLGRSYGDPAQNAGGDVLLPVPGPLEVDATAGVVRVAAGTSLHDLMVELLPRGLFLPVTPGTRYVTVGGAIACDVHGKSHHVAGSFGEHVVSLDLVTADGATRTLGPDRDPELFWATVGGMGLTGVITRAELRTIPVETSSMSVTTTRLPDLDAAMAAMRSTDAGFTYSVAWIDTLARGRSMGRSVLSQGEHATRGELAGRAARHPLSPPGRPRLAAPRRLPGGLVRPATVRAFNEAWFHKAPRHRSGEIQSIASFFHPLDGVGAWNRLYGPRGFVQYQCVVPDDAEETMTRIVERISGQGHASFLSVLKRFGPGDPGLLSFPMAGWTLALDLPAHPGLATLLEELDELVVGVGGRVYLAKDARVGPARLREMYPRVDDFLAVRRRVDPARVFRSDLSRRLEL
ncbi:FAD-binding oxidoreductase [Nocardioides koreensis]|uniref:FAD-binding oxidoreductase n=1 Tax=Nocardioides koreensis TaxID=433651 RepID=A0ABP5LSZ1_9ACTN